MVGSREPLEAHEQKSHTMKAGFQGDQWTATDKMHGKTDICEKAEATIQQWPITVIWEALKIHFEPGLMWLSGLSAGLWAERSLV